MARPRDTCDGADVSPRSRVGRAFGCEDWVLIVDDPDAPDPASRSGSTSTGHLQYSGERHQACGGSRADRLARRSEAWDNDWASILMEDRAPRSAGIGLLQALRLDTELKDCETPPGRLEKPWGAPRRHAELSARTENEEMRAPRVPLSGSAQGPDRKPYPPYATTNAVN